MHHYIAKSNVCSNPLHSVTSIYLYVYLTKLKLNMFKLNLMCYCKPCRCLDLSVLVGILSGVDSDHGTDHRRNDSVNSRSALYPIERRSC